MQFFKLAAESDSAMKLNEFPSEKGAVSRNLLESITESSIVKLLSKPRIAALGNTLISSVVILILQDRTCKISVYFEFVLKNWLLSKVMLEEVIKNKPILLCDV